MHARNRKQKKEEEKRKKEENEKVLESMRRLFLSAVVYFSLNRVLN